MATVTEDLIDLAYTGAKSIIEDGREVVPMGFVCTADGFAPIPLPWEDDDDKDRMMWALRGVCALPEVLAYAVLSEAWMVRMKPEMGELKVMPSEHPERIECIQIVAQERGKKMMMATAVIERKDGKRTLGPRTTQNWDDYAGRMVNLFEPLEATH